MPQDWATNDGMGGKTHDWALLLPLALPPDLPPVILMDLGELDNWVCVVDKLELDVRSWLMRKRGYGCVDAGDNGWRNL